MKDSTNAQSSSQQESQAVLEWREWQAQHAARREAKGYNEVVTDEEALDILGAA